MGRIHTYMTPQAVRGLASNAASAALLCIVLFLVATCGGGGGGGGVSSSGGTGASVGPDPGPEVSALYGINELAGEFNVSVDSSGAMTVETVSSDSVSLAGNSSIAASTLSLNLTVTNASGSSLSNVKLRITGLSSPTAISSNNGKSAFALGELGLYGNANLAITITDASVPMSFKIYVTRQKEDIPSMTIETAAGSTASLAASLFTISEGKRTLSNPQSKAMTATITDGAAASLKVDVYGNPKASYLDINNLDLKYVYWNGSYTTVTVDGTGKTGYYNSLALTSLGNPRIAYYSAEDSSGTPTRNLRYAYCNSNCNSAANWGAIDLDTTGDVGGYTSIAVDSSDAANPRPRIAYYDFTNQNLKFAYCEATCNDAANWRIITVASSGVVGEYASLALAPSNTKPRISYYDHTNGDLKWAYCNATWATDGTGCDNAANWTIETVDNSSSSDVGGYTSIVYNPVTGKVAISYYDFANKDLVYTYSSDYATGSSNLGAENFVMGGISSSPTGSAEIMQYINTSGQTRYRMYYTIHNGPKANTGDYHQPGYRDTTDSNPPAANCSNCTGGVNWGAGDILWPGWWFRSADKMSVIPIGGGKYRMYYGAMNNDSSWMIPYQDTTTTNNMPPSAGAMGTLYYVTKSITDNYTNIRYSGNPEVIQFTNSSGQTRYRIYYNTDINRNPSYIAYKETTDANPPWCTVNSGTGSTFACTTGNIGAEVNTGIAAAQFAGGPQLATLPDGKWRIYFPSPEDGLAYRDTTDVYPPTSSNIGVRQLLGFTGYDPSMVQTASGYRLYYHNYNAGGYKQIVYRDTTDSNLPTAPGGTSCCSWNTVRVDNTRFTCGGVLACSLYDTNHFEIMMYDRGAFSSVSFDISGRPRISYYSRASLTANGLECAFAQCYTNDTKGDMMLASCNADDCKDQSNRTIQQLDTANDTGWFTSSATSPGLHNFIAYYDATTADFKIYTVSSNTGSQQTLGIGTSAANSADSPDVVKMDDGKYRLYYHIYDGTYRRIAYKETTNTNPPDTNGSNLGSEVALLGTSSTDSAYYPEILRLSDNTYRLYYKYDDSGGNINVAYRDTADTNPPAPGTNLGSQTSLGVATSRMPDVLKATGGKYRIYYADFSATYGRIAYRDTTTTDWTLPGASNIDASATLVNVGGTSTDNVNGPSVVLLPDNRYRLYYTKNNGTYNDIAYRDTSDTNLPDSTNLGGETLFGLSTSSSDEAISAVVVALTGGRYRMYYEKWNGTYSQLAYRDTTTTDGSLPDVSNIGAETLMGIGSSASDRAAAPEAIQLSNGKWRIYYSYYTTYYQLAFRETTDTNPPSASNISSIRYLYTGAASPNSAYGPEVVRFDDASKYRVYYMTNNAAWELVYKDTTDAYAPHDLLGPASYIPNLINIGRLAFKVYPNSSGGYRFYGGGWTGLLRHVKYWDTTNSNPPDSGNIPASGTVMLGGTFAEEASGIDIIQMPSNGFRLYYDSKQMTIYFQTAYRDTTDTNAPDATNLGARYTIGLGGPINSVYSPELLLMDSGKYRLFFSKVMGTYSTLYFVDTTDGDPPTSY